jgi:hypothetical protein
MMQGLPESKPELREPGPEAILDLLNGAIGDDSVSGSTLAAATPSFAAIRLTLTD